MQQAERDAQRVALRDAPAEPWRVTMTLNAWIALYKRALSGDFGRSEPPERMGNTR